MQKKLFLGDFSIELPRVQKLPTKIGVGSFAALLMSLRAGTVDTRRPNEEASNRMPPAFAHTPCKRRQAGRDINANKPWKSAKNSMFRKGAN